MMDIYEAVPMLSDGFVTLRPLDEDDTDDLFKVYTDKLTLELLNNDNLDTPFSINTIEQMQMMVEAWFSDYERRSSVRWTIYVKGSLEAVGTIEMKAAGIINGISCGVLKMDLRSDYEHENIILGILSIVDAYFHEMFEVNRIYTKSFPLSEERTKALLACSFIPDEENLLGYSNYFYKD